MIPAAFVDTYPCETCEHVKTVHDVPPYTRCRVSLTGDFECDRMQTIARVAQRAEQVAALIAREPDMRLRAEEAQQIADAYADTLYELGAGFDDEMFYRACEVPKSCLRCDARKGGDGWDIRCASCAEVEVPA